MWWMQGSRDSLSSKWRINEEVWTELNKNDVLEILQRAQFMEKNKFNISQSC